MHMSGRCAKACWRCDSSTPNFKHRIKMATVDPATPPQVSKSLKQRLRPWVPNCRLRIRHVEPGMSLQVRLREHLGFVARGLSTFEPHYVQVLRSLIKKGDRVF